MQIFMYLMCIILLFAVFELGRTIVERSDEWSSAITPEPGETAVLRKSFIVGGKIMQAVAVVWASANILAILISAPRL